VVRYMYARTEEKELNELKPMLQYSYMAVKAIHFEVISDLSTDAFLNTFKRFQ